MQIKLFTIPIDDSGSAQQEMNTFLRANKILEIENKLISNEHGAYWCFCVRYIERAFQGIGETKGKKIDYRKVLDEATFQKFSKLREIRKKVSAEQAISAYIVFTDAELAELAKLDEINEKNMRLIKGIGDKKVARFGEFFYSKSQSEDNETTRTPD